MLYDGGSAREFAHWDRVPDKRAVCAQLVPVLGIGRWASRLAARLLIAAQDPEVGDEIEAAIRGLRPHNRVLAGITAIALEHASAERRARFQLDADPMLRAAAAHVATGIFLDEGGATEDVAVALADGDGTVRDAALRLFDPKEISEAALRLIEPAAATAPAWTCTKCGRLNEGAGRACRECSTSAPEPQRKAMELLRAAASTGV
jgi:hypothetical protein